MAGRAGRSGQPNDRTWIAHHMLLTHRARLAIAGGRTSGRMTGGRLGGWAVGRVAKRVGRAPRPKRVDVSAMCAPACAVPYVLSYPMHPVLRSQQPTGWSTTNCHRRARQSTRSAARPTVRPPACPPARPNAHPLVRPSVRTPARPYALPYDRPLAHSCTHPPLVDRRVHETDCLVILN